MDNSAQAGIFPTASVLPGVSKQKICCLLILSAAISCLSTGGAQTVSAAAASALHPKQLKNGLICVIETEVPMMPMQSSITKVHLVIEWRHNDQILLLTSIFFPLVQKALHFKKDQKIVFNPHTYVL